MTKVYPFSWNCRIGVEKSPLLENPKVNEEIRSLASRRLLEKESLRILLPDSSPSSPSGGSGSGALFSPPGSQSPSKKLPLSGVRRKRTLEEMQEDEEGDGNGLEVSQQVFLLLLLWRILNHRPLPSLSFSRPPHDAGR